MKYLVIVESPAKISKITAFLNSIKQHNFIVDASYGHIFEFKNNIKSIDIDNNFKAEYAICKSKLKIVSKLKKLSKQVDEVIIATDQDREGEAIGYHLSNILNLNINTTKRIVFNEISKKAIIDAFNNPTNIDLNLYNSQQARSIIDILIGYNISPLLWKSVQPKLSAGRCQSPALKLIDEREKEIKDFITNSLYDISSYFTIKTKNKDYEVLGKFYKDINNKEKVITVIKKLINDKYLLSKSKVKNCSFAPPPPYITSSIQHDINVKFGISPINTMNCLQKLYESGKITYMRTDSIAISESFINQCKVYIKNNYSKEFTKRNYKSKIANAQEAHECIRPVSLEITKDSIDNEFEKKIYDLIWKRTISCFLPNYKEDIHEYKFTNSDNEYFYKNYKKIVDLGYKIIYQIENEDDNEIISNIVIDSNNYFSNKIEAKEKNTKPKPRYTEASLVKELENLGIGRPSTFSTIVNTLLLRKYVNKEVKDNKKEVELDFLSILPKQTLLENKYTSKVISQKGKLILTELGYFVNQYMDSNFSNINSYQFTSNINEELDKISRGDLVWHKLVLNVYNSFINKVNNLKKQTYISQNDNEQLILDGKNHKYFYYRDKYGINIIQQGDERKKKRNNSIDINNTNENELAELFEYPILIGKHNNIDIYINKGPYGLYTEIENTKLSISSKDISIDNLLILLKEKKKNVIKEWKQVKILKGPYGVYIKKGSKNVPLGNNIEVNNLTLKECENIIKTYKKPIFKKKKS